MMLQNVLNNAAKREQGEHIDAIIVVGDLCRHNMASKNESEPNPLWPLMEYTMTTAMEYVSNAFPGVPILPVIGNNDVEYHD
jgi:Icc-related predicted phosphoesterase